MQPKQSGSEKLTFALNQAWLATALKFGVIAAVVITLYLQDLSIVFTGALTNGATYQILAIPFLFGYLLYRKRKMVSASLQGHQPLARGFQKYFSTLAGISLAAVAILVYWYGSYSFTPIEYHMLTLPFLAAGLTLIMFNTQTLKQLLFPMAFLLFLTPPPDEILYGFGSWLANLSASASKSLANIFGMHATLSSSNAGPVITLLTPSHASLPFNVDVACSGIYSIIGFVIFAVFIAYIIRGKLVNKLSILVMGIPLILALNIIRITAILGIGYSFGENLALTFFHDIGATVLMFVGVIILLAITEKVFKQPKPTLPCPTCNSTAKPAEPFCPNCGKLIKLPKVKLTRGDVAKIIGIMLVATVLLSIQAPVFALTQSPPQVTVQTPSGPHIDASAAMLPNIAGQTLNYVYRDTSFEQESGDDMALVYAYSQPNTTVSTTWVAIQIAASVTSEHRWETCLVNLPLAEGNPSSVNQLDLRDFQLQANPPMTARYFSFQYKDTNQTQIVLYWYETARFSANATSQSKSVMISLITFPSATENLTAAENSLQPIAQAINNYWQPIQTWTVVALALSENGLALSVVASVVFAAVILYAVFYDWKERKLLLNLYGKLSEQDKNIVKAVVNGQRRGNPTNEGIVAELEKLTNSAFDRMCLTEKLFEAEDAGLVKEVIGNRNDEPIVQWINQVPQKSNFVGQLPHLFHF
jgi:exosortase